MDILLIVATLVVAAAGLYVAATFNRRTRQNFAPLIEDAVKDVSEHIESVAEDLRGRIRVIADELQRDRDQSRLDARKTQGRLDHADSRTTTIASQLSTELETIKRSVEQLGGRPAVTENSREDPEHGRSWWEPPPRPRDPDQE